MSLASSNRPASRIRICIIAPHALPVALPGISGNFGGLETAAWLTARALARRPELDVSLLARHHRRLRKQTISGVHVLVRAAPLEILRESLAGRASVRPRFPWISLQRWEPSLLWKLPLLACLKPFKRPARDPREPDPDLVSLPADVFCAFGVNAVSASVIASARQKQARSLLFIQSNNDLNPRFAADPTYRNEYGELGSVCRHALQAADVVITQTQQQDQWLRDRFGRSSVVLGNPFDHAEWEELRLAPGSLPFTPPADRYALWIGREDRNHKRPLLFLEAARNCPNVPFLMILNRGDVNVRDEILRTSPPNVQIVEKVSFQLMPKIFSKAAMLVFTGSAEHEGLPNVLLQAAASAVPIVSLSFLPDLLENQPFAIMAGTTEKLADIVREIWNDAANGRRLGELGQDYIQTHFDLDHYAARLAAVIES
jgi:glycosyltransferase involved in cell wall biosynthesis